MMEKNGEIREGVTPEPERVPGTITQGNGSTIKVGAGGERVRGAGRFDGDVVKRGADLVEQQKRGGG